MKLLQIVSSIDPAAGGVAECVRQTSLELARLGHTVEFLTLDEPTSEYVIDFPMPIEATGPSRGTYGYNSRFRKALGERSRSFDAVVVNGLWQYHGWASWRVLSKNKTPYFVFTHGMLDPWFRRQYPLKHLKKSLYWPWADYRLLRDAQAVLFTSEDERLLARESFRLYRATEAVAGLGIAEPPSGDPDMFFHTYPQLRGRRIALFMGRIHEKKGCDILMEAFARVCREERLHLVMAGPGQTDLVTHLQDRALTLGVEARLTWTGMLEGDLKWSALQAAEVFVLPSHQENFGVAVVEALACGTPVVISNKVNIWREIETDGAGFVDEDTIEGTTENLTRWLALSPQQYSTMCSNAVSCFESRFGVREAAERLVRIVRGDV